MSMQLILMLFKKKVNANRVCTGEINVHTSTHLQISEIVQLVTHLGITAYSQFPKYKMTKRIHKVNMYTQETVYVKKPINVTSTYVGPRSVRR